MKQIVSPSRQSTGQDCELVGGVQLDPGIIRTSWGGLGKVLGRMCREVAWSGQALSPFSLSPEQGHLYLFKFQPKDKVPLSL